eukprot:m.354493 g.354493  ORF g.354493 m.354493 type:complete len:166 (-) comp20717_c0_seq64:2493-2990(-)
MIESTHMLLVIGGCIVMSLSGIAQPVPPQPAAPSGPGRSFGTGLAGVSICPKPQVVLNYTLSPKASHGVLHHFWVTGTRVQIDEAWIDYFIDGESSPSISMQPSMMCGLAFPAEVNETFLYSAGASCGKNAAVGGWFNTFPIPFGNSVLVTVQYMSLCMCACTGW